MPTSKLSFMTSTVAEVTSLPALVSSAPPIEVDGVRDLVRAARRRSLVQQRCDEGRRATLSRRIVWPLRPERSGACVTSGCSWCITTITCIPFASVRSSYGGKLTGRDGSGRGGFSEGQFATT